MGIEKKFQKLTDRRRMQYHTDMATKGAQEITKKTEKTAVDLPSESAVDNTTQEQIKDTKKSE